MHFSKKRESLSLQIKELGIITAISSLGIALIATIWAIYFEEIFKDPSKVGFINTLFGIVGILSLIIFIPLIEKNSKTRILTISILMYSISYLLFSFLKSAHAIIVLGIVLAMSSSLRLNTIGIILRDKSKDNAVSKNTGMIYTLLNGSWLLAPILAGFIAEKLGIKFVFIIAGIIMFLSFLLLSSFKLKDDRIKKKIDKNLFKLVKEFFSKKKFFFAYVISGGISFWWSFIYIYMPIFIIESGKNELLVGYFLAGVVVPLILLEFIFGKIAGKTGFTKIFFRGYLIMAIAGILCFFINDIYAILILLVLGSVGVAMLEPTTEAYFLDITGKTQRDKYYGIYNTTIDISHVLSLFIIALLIKFLPFKYSFIFIGVIMGIFALLSLRIKNVIESRRKG